MIAESPLASLDETASPAALQPAGAPLRILVVEDGKNAADILALFFELEGHEVAVAYNGEDAVDRALAMKPDLVMMDIGLPKMSGLDAARQIRREAGTRGIVIVALSGLDQDDDKRQCSAAGIDEHLAKPVGPADLRSLIARYRTRFTAPAAL